MSSGPNDLDGSGSTTKSLVRRTQAGDAHAADRLFRRLLAAIHRWSHGRLPRGSRGLVDTADMAQEVAIGAWRNLDRVSLKRPGDLEAYVRQAVWNRIRDEARRVQRLPDTEQLSSAVPASGTSPLEQSISSQQFSEYRAALAQLTSAEREALIARLELGYSFQEVATLLGKPSADAARMVVNRAFDRLLATLDQNQSE